LRHHVTL